MPLLLSASHITSPMQTAGYAIGQTVYNLYNFPKSALVAAYLSAASLIKTTPTQPTAADLTAEIGLDGDITAGSTSQLTAKDAWKKTCNAFVALPIDLLKACAVMTIKIVDLLAVTAVTLVYSAFKFVSAALTYSNIANEHDRTSKLYQAHDKFDRFMNETPSPAHVSFYEDSTLGHVRGFAERVKRAVSFDVAASL